MTIATANGTTTFVYDGDGNRVKKHALSEAEGTDNGETVLYVNGYYEKNLTTGNVTTYYYLGDKLVAMRQSSTLGYIHQDSLSGTSVMSDSSGNSTGSIRYAPFGSTRSGSVPTDKLFTGQRLDDTGLYYYGARYYDPTIGRFISPDSIVQDFANPQSFNRYTYVLNNPLKYTDPSGMKVEFDFGVGSTFKEIWDLGLPFDYSAFGDVADLYQAYNDFSAAAPEVAAALESAEEIVRIGWGDAPNGAADTSAYIEGKITIRLGTLDEAAKTAPGQVVQYAASLLGHESVHAIARIADHASRTNLQASNSIYEESLGFNMGNYVAQQTGFSGRWDIPLPGVQKMGASLYISNDLSASMSKTRSDWQGIDQLRQGYGSLDLLPSWIVFQALRTQIIYPVFFH